MIDPLFSTNTENDPEGGDVTLETATFYQLGVDVDKSGDFDATKDLDGLGNPAYRYFIAVKPDVSKEAGGRWHHRRPIPQVIELTTVQVESKTDTVRVKDASAFNYIAYGVWATRPDAKKVRRLNSAQDI